MDLEEITAEVWLVRLVGWYGDVPLHLAAWDAAFSAVDHAIKQLFYFLF